MPKGSKIIVKIYFKLKPKSTQNGGSGASYWGVGGFILEPFLGSEPILAPKCVLGGVWGVSWVLLEAKMAITWAPDGTNLEPKS